MKHLFSAQGATALAALLRRRPLLAFDFDGTLAPIVPRPRRRAHSARPWPRGLRGWRGGCRWPSSPGRAVADVRGRLGFEPRFVVGNHGAEDAADAAVADGADAQRSTRCAAHRGPRRCHRCRRRHRRGQGRSRSRCTTGWRPTANARARAIDALQLTDDPALQPVLRQDGRQCRGGRRARQGRGGAFAGGARQLRAVRSSPATTSTTSRCSSPRRRTG